MSAERDDRAALRRSVYALLIALSVGAMSGRLLAVNSVDMIRLESHLKNQGKPEWKKQRPFLSANDRSRWLTIRALVEHGTFEIDEVIAEPNWDSIDIVQHPNTEGQPRLYSSKPPLLATLYAPFYWIIYKTTGATLGTHPYEIGRPLVFLFNIVPLIVFFGLLARLLERYGRSDWGRLFVMAAATFGTFLTTFAVVINNHLPGAVCTLAALYSALRIWYDGERRLRYFAAAGLFGAMVAACELPGLLFFAILSAGLLWKAPRLALIGYVPAALIVLAAYLGTNYAAHSSWRPPYAHRSPTDPDDNWYEFTYVRRSDGKRVESYWTTGKQTGIDKGEPSRAAYILHALIGHHGVFSLTPMWLLSIPGVLLLWRGRDYNLRDLAILIAVVSLVVMAFYLSMQQRERNYGGMTSAFRWAFWMAPLWLLAMLPTADWLAARRWGRGLALLMLALSVMSASYPTWNPWTHPWLMNLMLHLEWVSL